MTDTRHLRAVLRIHLADGVGPVLFRRLVDSFGDAESVVEASSPQWRKVEGVGPKTAEAMSAVTERDVDEEISLAGKHGVEIICDDDECYPAALKTIFDPPVVLYVRGRLERTDAVALGVVGSRRCTHYGIEQAERFGQLLGRAGFTVVSGGARGIDTAAHRGALAAGGRTIAVMGCGLCHTYPSENDQLFEQIVRDEGGAIVSELPMRTAVLGGNFPMRNRIISGLSLGVVIVEAARRSGSLITARESAEQGREVFAIPGRIDSPLSSGVNQLIRDGAILIQNLDDILEHLGQVGAKLSADQGPHTNVLPAGLTPTETLLLEALTDKPLTLDELVRTSKLDSGKVASSMTMLVLKGAVSQQAGNVFARK